MSGILILACTYQPVVGRLNLLVTIPLNQVANPLLASAYWAVGPEVFRTAVSASPSLTPTWLGPYISASVPGPPLAGLFGPL